MGAKIQINAVPKITRNDPASVTDTTPLYYHLS